MSRKESWKTGEKKLRKSFDESLEWIWQKWDEFFDEGTPFGNLNRVFDEMELSSLEIADYYYNVGWTRGVSESTGWPLSRPGPREWSPRD